MAHRIGSSAVEAVQGTGFDQGNPFDRQHGRNIFFCSRAFIFRVDPPRTRRLSPDRRNDRLYDRRPSDGVGSDPRASTNRRAAPRDVAQHVPDPTPAPDAFVITPNEVGVWRAAARRSGWRIMLKPRRTPRADARAGPSTRPFPKERCPMAQGVRIDHGHPCGPPRRTTGRNSPL